MFLNILHFSWKLDARFYSLCLIINQLWRIFGNFKYFDSCLIYAKLTNSVPDKLINSKGVLLGQVIVCNKISCTNANINSISSILWPWNQKFLTFLETLFFSIPNFKWDFNLYFLNFKLKLYSSQQSTILRSRRPLNASGIYFLTSSMIFCWKLTYFLWDKYFLNRIL